jgi:hypothetical protein
MGRRQCELDGCTKGAASGGTPHCVAHGGGKRCQEEGCVKSAAGGGTPHCVAHGGGKPRGGLLEVGCAQHGLLHLAWWGHALPRGGLP